MEQSLYWDLIINDLKTAERMQKIRPSGQNSSPDPAAEMQVRREHEKSFKGIMEQYKDNTVYMNAAVGKKSIPQTLEELCNKHKGINRLIPLSIDKPYNQMLEDYSKLSGVPAGRLRTKGLFYLDNPLNAFLLLFSGALIYGSIGENIILDALQNPYNYMLSSGFAAFFLRPNIDKKKPKYTSLFNQAEHVQKKIELLYDAKK